jgi:hypothetical protein
MANWKIALIVAYFTVLPGCVGYHVALAKENGPGVTLFVCSMFIGFFMIGAAIKYWFGHG